MQIFLGRPHVVLRRVVLALLSSAAFNGPYGSHVKSFKLTFDHFPESREAHRASFCASERQTIQAILCAVAVVAYVWCAERLTASAKGSSSSRCGQTTVRPLMSGVYCPAGDGSKPDPDLQSTSARTSQRNIHSSEWFFRAKCRSSRKPLIPNAYVCLIAGARSAMLNLLSLKRDRTLNTELACVRASWSAGFK
jgi:hypothetical protein